jgi:hypothetical protein
MNGQESRSVEKLDEMPDWETTNRVFDGVNRIPTTANFIAHPDGYSSEDKT